jgi:hypothetical protein
MHYCGPDMHYFLVPSPVTRALGHLQWVDVSRMCVSDQVRPNRYAGFACSSGAMHPDRRVWPDASVHLIWVTDASTWTGALSTRALPRGYRPHMAATQWTIAMLVKGWVRGLAVCCAAPSLCSTHRHWQPTAPPDAWRGHFNAGAWTSVLASNAISPL